MTMLTHSEVEIDFDFDPCVVADQLCRGVQPAEEMEACRSLCDAIGREFAEAAFQLLSSGTLGAAFSAFERQVQMSGPRALIEGVFGGRFPRDFGELGGIWGVDRAAEM